MRLPVLLSLVMAGCSWVGGSDLDCQLLLVDDDGDGYALNMVEDGYTGEDWCDHVVPVDCDDTNPAMHPEGDETWYDGVDSNCAGDDDFDQDGDGYVPADYFQQATQGVPTSGGLPGGDCDDTAQAVNPGAPDVAYDGIDTNCNGKDDFDQDGDGYVPDAYAALATQYVTGSGALPTGDCDDAMFDVNPLATDPWYDGVDTNCDGLDDYDQDQDGFVPTTYAGMETLYVEDSGRLPGADCDDTDATIWPGATDAWYDGVDSDCRSDNDYDQDGDGYDSELDPSGGDDCDDLSADAHPGAVEVLDDGADWDCDGGSDSFGMADFVGFTWTDVAGMDFSIDADEVFLSVSAAEIVYGATHYYDGFFSLVMDVVDPGTGLEHAYVPLQYMSDPVGNSLAQGLATTVDDEAIYGLLGWNMSTGRQLVVRRYDLTGTLTNPRSSASPTIGDETLTFQDVSLAFDEDGDLHGVGCTDADEDGAMGYVWVNPDTMVASNKYESFGALDVSGYPCSLDFFSVDGTGTLFVNEGMGDLVAYRFDRCPSSSGCSLDLEEVLTAPEYAPTSMEVLDSGSGQRLMVMADGTSGVIVVLAVDVGFVYTPLMTVDLPGDQVPTAVTARLSPGGTVYIAYVTDAGNVGLAYGRVRLGTTLTQASFVTDFTADRVSLELSGDGSMLYLAASGNDLVSGTDRVVFGYAAL